MKNKFMTLIWSIAAMGILYSAVKTYVTVENTPVQAVLLICVCVVCSSIFGSKNG